MENGRSESANCLSNRLVPELSEIDCFMIFYLVDPFPVVTFMDVTLEVGHRPAEGHWLGGLVYFVVAVTLSDLFLKFPSLGFSCCCRPCRHKMGSFLLVLI